MKITIRSTNDTLSAFKLRSELNQHIWEGDAHLHPEVRARLMKIANDFIENLDLASVTIKDIVITGSIANYNWSKYSDIDVHILVDFLEVDENAELVKRFFDAIRSNWNKTHLIRVKGHEVELYIQDEKEPHTSTGVYSLLHEKWVVKPQLENPTLDRLNVKKKSLTFMREIDKIESLLKLEEYPRVEKEGQRLNDKIKRMRHAGLDSGGIYSVENLTFKVLRRSGHLKKLFDAVRQSYDASMSLAD